jgi:uncharacterized protein YggU (UPF0235/DUF167 family)
MSEGVLGDAPGGVEVRIRATPRGRRDALEGTQVLSDGRQVLKVRVRAAPEDGAANDAVRRILAKALDRPLSAVRLTAGASARLKTLLVAGDAVHIARRVRDLTATRAA